MSSVIIVRTRIPDRNQPSKNNILTGERPIERHNAVGVVWSHPAWRLSGVSPPRVRPERRTVSRPSGPGLLPSRNYLDSPTLGCPVCVPAHQQVSQGAEDRARDSEAWNLQAFRITKRATKGCATLDDLAVLVAFDRFRPLVSCSLSLLSFSLVARHDLWNRSYEESTSQTVWIERRGSLDCVWSTCILWVP